MKTIVVLAFTFFFLIGCGGASSQNQAPDVEQQTISKSGTIRVVGNEPFTHVVLTETVDNISSDTLILGGLEEELRTSYQGNFVTLEGVVCASPFSEFSRCFTPKKII